MFLIVSAIHFGISDTIHKGNLFYIEIFFRVALPLAMYNSSTPTIRFSIMLNILINIESPNSVNLF